MMLKSTLVGTALAVAAISANALVTASTGAYSMTSFISILSGGSSLGSVNGGAVYLDTENFPSTAARPESVADGYVTVGNWFAAGPSNVSTDAVLTLGAGTTGVSFLWGSPDTYNSFSVTTELGTTDFAPGVFGVPLSDLPNQDNAYYVKFSTSGESILSVNFKSPGTNAIEIANVAVVPEPEAYGLALAGLGVVGFAMTRRRKS